MAWTITRYNKNYADDRVVHLDITPDSATFNVDTGLKIITAFHTGESSMSSANIHIYMNTGCGATALGGILGVTGVTSGDRFFITAYGR